MIIHPVPDEVILEAMELLERDGYINDENTQLGSAIDNQKSHIIEVMERLGYAGGPIKSGARFYQGYGNVYWLFDADVMDHADAGEMTDRWVKAQAKLDR